MYLSKYTIKYISKVKVNTCAAHSNSTGSPTLGSEVPCRTAWIFGETSPGPGGGGESTKRPGRLNWRAFPPAPLSLVWQRNRAEESSPVAESTTRV